MWTDLNDTEHYIKLPCKSMNENECVNILKELYIYYNVKGQSFTHSFVSSAG